MPENDLDLNQEQEAPEEAKKGGMLKLIIIGVAVVVLGVGGFFGWQLFMGDEPAAEDQAQPEAAQEKDKEKAAPTEEAPKSLVKMEPFIVNLADPGGKRYLKLTLSLDVADELLKAEVEKRMPRIRDSLLLLLSSKTYEDLAPVSGKIKLRNQVLSIVNRSLGGGDGVHAVYFSEFVIQ